MLPSFSSGGMYAARLHLRIYTIFIRGPRILRVFSALTSVKPPLLRLTPISSLVSLPELSPPRWGLLACFILGVTPVKSHCALALFLPLPLTTLTALS
jgi:hypothetical protein